MPANICVSPRKFSLLVRIWCRSLGRLMLKNHETFQPNQLAKKVMFSQNFKAWLLHRADQSKKKKRKKRKERYLGRSGDPLDYWFMFVSIFFAEALFFFVSSSLDLSVISPLSSPKCFTEKTGNLLKETSKSSSLKKNPILLWKDYVLLKKTNCGFYSWTEKALNHYIFLFKHQWKKSGANRRAASVAYHWAVCADGRRPIRLTLCPYFSRWCSNFCTFW